MKRAFNNIISRLTPGERRRFNLLIIGDALVSILDIAFLAALLFVVGFYTKNLDNASLLFIPFSFLEKNPLLLITLFFILFSLKNALAYAVIRAQFHFVYSVASRISQNNLEQYLDDSYESFVSVDSSVHIRRISQQPVEFSHYVLRGVQQVISNCFILVFTILPILIFSGTLFLILVLTLLPPAWLAVVLIRKKLASIRAMNKKTREKNLQHLQEALAGFIEINVDGRKPFFTRRYAMFQEEFNKSLAGLQVVQSLPPRLMEVFAVFGLFLLTVSASLLGSGISIDVLLIGGFMAAAYKIMPGIVKIINSLEQIKTYGYTVEDLVRKPVASQNSVSIHPGALTEIEIQNMTFRYGGKTIVTDFSLRLKKGELTGLSGISGSGKTTLINVLLGFLEPDSGIIFFNGKPLDAQQRKKYWDDISYARQQPFIIHESIRTNILLGEKAEENRFKESLSATGLDVHSERFEEGLDTVIAEEGRNISGGQRQRVILSRMLYKNAGLVIVDESLNELDGASRKMILGNLKKLAEKGKMILIVTHDEECLSACDTVYVIPSVSMP